MGPAVEERGGGGGEFVVPRENNELKSTDYSWKFCGQTENESRPAFLLLSSTGFNAAGPVSVVRVPAGDGGPRSMKSSSPLATRRPGRYGRMLDVSET